MTHLKIVSAGVPEGFIRMADVFTAAEFREWRGAAEWSHDFVQKTWFPEIPALEWADTSKIMEERRLKARELVYKNIDGNRHALVLTLWFDDKSFAIVQEGGRSGRDYRRRIVADKAVLSQAAAYVIQNMVFHAEFDRETVEVGLDDVLPVEEIFDFYSGGTAKSLGYHVAQPRRDLFDYAGNWEEQHLAPILVRGELLIVAKGVAPVEHLRSGGMYFAFVRELSAQDIAKVHNLDAMRDAMAAEDINAGKSVALLVYRKLEKPPVNFAEAVPL